MTTIAALNVRLGMDASNFSAGINLARNEVNRVSQIMRQSVPPAEKMRQELSLLERTFSSAGKQTKEYANAVDFLKRKYQETERPQNSMIAGVRSLVAGYVSLQTVRSVVTIASDIEAAAIQFEVLTGSVDEANAMLAEMRSFAAASPLSLAGVQKAGQVLLSFGTQADEVMGKVRLLGDITGGNQQRFESLTLAYAQASAAGRLMGQDLLQMVNAGFNPLLEISDMTGLSLIELKKAMEEGKISIDMVDAALKRATSQGGRFFGMTDKLGKSFGGALAQLMSAVSELAGEIGKSFLPALTSIVQSAESVVRWLMQTWQTMGNVGRSFTLGTAAMLAAIPAISGITYAASTLITILRGVAIAQASVLAMSGPAGWALLAVGVASAAAAYAALSRSSVEATQTTALAGSLKALADSAASTMDAVAAKSAAAAKAAAEVEAAARKAFRAELDASIVHGEMLATLMLQRLELKYSEEEFQKIELRMKGLNDQQIESIQKIRQEIELLKQKKQIEEDFKQSQQEALEAAKQYFAAEKAADEQRRKRITGGPSSIEVGSAEAARRQAEAFNARIAAAAVPDRAEPTEKQFIDKAVELLKSQEEANRKQEALTKAMEQATATMLATRVQRIR